MIFLQMFNIILFKKTKITFQIKLFPLLTQPASCFEGSRFNFRLHEWLAILSQCLVSPTCRAQPTGRGEARFVTAYATLSLGHAI